jgi:hypothetical protein
MRDAVQPCANDSLGARLRRVAAAATLSAPRMVLVLIRISVPVPFSGLATVASGVMVLDDPTKWTRFWCLPA